MQVGIIHVQPGLSDYLAELFQAWGLTGCRQVRGDEVQALDPAAVPVLLCPAHPAGEELAAARVAYAARGGALFSFLPEGELARAAGLTREGDLEGPLRLRLTRDRAAGLAGESLPIVGPAVRYRPEDDLEVLGYLSHSGQYQGECEGITECRVGAGRIIAFAFDLPQCVLWLRQGDPAHAEVIPSGDSCARPSHLACDIGPQDAAWIPFADLLSRYLVDLVRGCVPAPMPLLSVLPGEAPGLLLYSGDEDHAEVAWNDEELEYLATAGARMSLYIIPTRTHSSRVDVERYARHHDVGPHPDLRSLDGRPVSERVAEFERQVLLFESSFGVKSRTLRNHCTAWAGYLELVEAEERLGIRMDANYLSGTYMRDRCGAPYAGFGGAIPVRFCRPDGRLLEVFQQHTHLSDDVMFGEADYSYKYSAPSYEAVIDRVLKEVATRFHTPYGTLIHPSNWVWFSRDQGQALLRRAAAYGVPVWSYDQWLDFWEARHTWQIDNLSWAGGELVFDVRGEVGDTELRLVLPVLFAGSKLVEVQVDGRAVEGTRVERYGEDVILVPVPIDRKAVAVKARYC